jgi:phosphatidylethanolamine/phosphatidyl-N-methylethanolamine N-methyltransferase
MNIFHRIRSLTINTNRWNIIRYTLFTPGYDFIASWFSASRKRSLEGLAIKEGDKVLIIGAGTGLDLEYIPRGCKIVATDITPSMVERVRKRNTQMKHHLEAMVMDGQHLTFADNTFDKIILHLILAVIPDPVACIRETERVLRSGGQIVIFDKFVPRNRRISGRRRFANLFANLLFSDITRDFESIAKNATLTLVSDEDADFNGNFRLIKMKK